MANVTGAPAPSNWQVAHEAWRQVYQAAVKKRDALCAKTRLLARKRLAEIHPALSGTDFAHLAYNWYVCGPNQWQAEDPTYPERRTRVLEILAACDLMERAANRQYDATMQAAEEALCAAQGG